MNNEIRLRGRKALFCISHIPPFLHLPDDVNLIQTAAFDTPLNHFSVQEYLQERKICSTQGFAVDYCLAMIADLVKQRRDDIDFVVIMLHRKLVVTQPIGSEAASFSHMRLEAADHVNVDAVINSYPDNTVVPIPLNFRITLAEQYGSCHVLQDYFRLLSICLDHRILSNNDATALCNERLMIWGAGLGQLSTDIMLRLGDAQARLMHALNSTDFQCAQPNDRYQKRCISFFFERLGSLLLTRELQRQAIITKNEQGDIVMSLAHLGYGCTVSQGSVAPNDYIIGVH